MLNLVQITVFSLMFSIILISLGNRFLKLFKNISQDGLLIYSLSYLIGLSVFTYGLVGLGIFGLFNLKYISIYIIMLILFSISNLANIFKKLFLNLNRNHHFSFKIDADLILNLLIIIIIFSNYIACFAPPTTWDEIAYHIPEAKSIISAQKISFPINGDYIYGNLPASMEVLYAFAISLFGYSFMHVLHFSYLISFVFLIYYFVREIYNKTAARISIVFIFLLTELVSNATSGLIDFAASSLEIIGLFLFLQWFRYKKNDYLKLAGLFYGFSLSIKYTAFYSLLTVILLTFLYILYLNKKYKEGVKNASKYLFSFFLFLLLGGGFWYIKNWFLFGNPVYPYIFGHPGISNEEFIVIENAVKSSVVPISLFNFIKTPFIFFFPNPAVLQNGIVFASFFLAPFAVFYNKSRKITLLLYLLFFLNLALWFFLITHQTRFLFSVLIILMVLSAVSVFNIFSSLKKGWPFLLLSAILIINHSFNLGYEKYPTSKIFLLDYFRIRTVDLMLGKITEVDYLKEKYSDFIYITNFINNNYENSVILNYWNHNAYFYLKRNNTYTIDVPIQPNEYDSFVKEKRISFLAVDSTMKKAFLENKNWETWRAPRIDFENYIMENSTKVFEYNGNFLYEINK